MIVILSRISHGSKNGFSECLGFTRWIEVVQIVQLDGRVTLCLGMGKYINKYIQKKGGSPCWLNTVRLACRATCRACAGALRVSHRGDRGDNGFFVLLPTLRLGVFALFPETASSINHPLTLGPRSQGTLSLSLSRLSFYIIYYYIPEEWRAPKSDSWAHGGGGVRGAPCGRRGHRAPAGKEMI